MTRPTHDITPDPYNYASIEAIFEGYDYEAGITPEPGIKLVVHHKAKGKTETSRENA